MDIGKIVERAMLNKRSRHTLIPTQHVFDVPSEYKYFFTHPSGKIWGVYVTYYRWDWDDTHRFKNYDTVILFSGMPGKIRYNIGYRADRLDSYKNRKVRHEGYSRYAGPNMRDDYPEVCDTIDRIVMWMELKR